jgi:hypothetical protein
MTPLLQVAHIFLQQQLYSYTKIMVKQSQSQDLRGQ